MAAEPVNSMMGRRLMMAEPTNQGDENIVPFKRGSSKERIMVKPQYLEDAELRIHLPAKAKEFLQYLNKGTYYKKGIHDNEGSVVHWCLFDMRTCMTALETYKPNVIRIRNYLVALRVIETRLDADGQIWIGWNLNADEWLSPPKHGGIRAGAGHPKRFQDDNSSIQDDNERTAQKPIQDDNEIFQDDNDQTRKRFQDDNERTARGKVVTSVAASLRNVTKNLQELTDANASGDGAKATAPSPLPAAPLADVVTTTTGDVTANTITPQGPSTKRRSSAAPAARASPQKTTVHKGNEAWKNDPAWQAFFDGCMRLITDRYPDAVNYGKEGGALVNLFRAKHATLEEVKGYWESLLLESYWDTHDLSFAILAQNIGSYRRKIQGLTSITPAKPKGYSNYGQPAKADRSPAVAHHESERPPDF